METSRTICYEPAIRFTGNTHRDISLNLNTASFWAIRWRPHRVTGWGTLSEPRQCPASSSFWLNHICNQKLFCKIMLQLGQLSAINCHKTTWILLSISVRCEQSSKNVNRPSGLLNNRVWKYRYKCVWFQCRILVKYHHHYFSDSTVFDQCVKDTILRNKY